MPTASAAYHSLATSAAIRQVGRYRVSSGVPASPGSAARAAVSSPGNGIGCHGVVTKAEADAIRAAFEQRGELSAAVATSLRSSPPQCGLKPPESRQHFRRFQPVGRDPRPEAGAGWPSAVLSA